MKFVIVIDCENEAFDPNPSAELARILEQLASRVRYQDDLMSRGYLMDVNGNKCGVYGVES